MLSDVGGIEDQGVDGGKIVDIPPLDIEEEGSLFAQRAADVSVVLGRIVARLRTAKGLAALKAESFPSTKNWP